MASQSSQWNDIAAADRFLSKRDYDRFNGRRLLQASLESGSIQFRISGEVCPPDKLRQARFDPETGLIHGWAPGGLTMTILSSDESDDKCWTSLIQDDSGLACEINMFELDEHVRKTRQLEAPEVKRRDVGGRPAKWNWGRAVAALGRYMLDNKAQSDPAQYAKFLRAWFAERHDGEAPDDKLIRQWSKEVFSTWKDPP